MLSRNPQGFFLMVESGLIDKYTHLLDMERAVYDTIMLDNAVKLARDWAAARGDDTLILVIADHNHPISLIGTIDDDMTTAPKAPLRERVGIYDKAGFPNYPAPDKDGYPPRVDVSRRLAIFSASSPDYYETFRPKLDDPNEPTVTGSDAGHLRRQREATATAPGAMLRLGNLPKYMNASVHSGEDVILTATGPGSERVRGQIDNTEVFRVMVEALGLGRCGRQRAHHNCFDASLAPSASEASFIQTILVSTWTRPAKVPKPQSTPAMTLSRPTARAYCTMRSATSSGCSTKFEVESITPGTMILPSGSLTSCQTFHSWPWRGLAPGNDTAMRLGLEDDVDDVLERHVAVVRAERRAPAHMHAHAVGRQVLHRLVERLDVERDDLAIVGDADAGIKRVGHREIGAVELQDEARLDDGAVLARSSRRRARTGIPRRSCSARSSDSARSGRATARS